MLCLRIANILQRVAHLDVCRYRADALAGTPRHPEEKNMAFGKLLTTLSVGMILLASTGRAAIIENSTYNFTYYAPFPSIHVSQPNMNTQEPHEVHVGTESAPEYHPVLQIGFWQDGFSTSELS